MRNWQKWLLGLPTIFAFSVGFTGLIAGRLWWFVGSWSDTLFVAVIGLMWLVGMALYPRDRSIRLRGTFTRRLVGLGLLSAIGVAARDRAHGPAAHRPATWSVVGLLLFALAALIGGSGLRALGRAYSPDTDVVRGRSLVTSGIYRYIRHPAYAALLLVTAAVPLLARSLQGLVAGMLLMIPSLALRIRDEEAELVRAYGEEYEAYARRTRRLIPFVF